MEAKDLDIGARFTLPREPSDIVYQRLLQHGNRTIHADGTISIIAWHERALNVLYIPEGTEVVLVQAGGK